VFAGAVEFSESVSVTHGVSFGILPAAVSGTAR
jgi:hypothetical protein